ncbi:MAG: pyruvate dehydrogenase (acetyl-transferring) E1 component subunit alpha [Tepidiformaceae bacterium]
MTKTRAKTVPGQPSSDQLRHFLYQMLLIRRFEERTGEMYTKGKVRGFLHLYIGEEACAVGAINALEARDKMITHYRDHGHAIARGIDPKRIMAELFGRVDGTSKGRGGSMHIFDKETNFYGGHAIVGGHMPVAVGLALASKLKGEDAVTMCIFGDGGVAEGEFHEALNLASLWKLPVVWFCENNGYGMGLPLAKSVANEIYKIASAYRIPSVRVDGMDVVQVHEETQKAVKHCRNGEGPYFIEAMTYRYRGHSMADAELYRQKSEVEEFRKRDAIERLKTRMIEQGALEQGDYDALVARAEEEVGEAIAFADASPQPEISTLFDYITKEPPGA